MLRHSIATISFFLSMATVCMGQFEPNQELSERKETLENIQANLDGILESFEEDRKKLKILQVKKLKDFNNSTKRVQQKLDSLQNEADRIIKEKIDAGIEDKMDKLVPEAELELDSATEISVDTGKHNDTSAKKEDDETGISLKEDKFVFHFGSDEDDDSSDDNLEKVQFDYLCFDLGFTNYLNDGKIGAPDNASFLELNEGKSSNVKLTAVKAGFSLVDHNLSLLTGLGIDYYNYRFRKQEVITSTDGDGLAIRQFSKDYDKYKLATQYAFAPLELRYETNPKDPSSSFKVAVGGKFGYLIRSHTKLKRDNGNKAKDFGNFNVNPIRLGSVFRIGYGNFLNFYATYGFTSVFEDEVQPDLKPVSVGIDLFGFNWD